MLDEELLERARRVLGEKTYSGTINKALEKAVRQDRFREAYRKFRDEVTKGDFFYPGYLEELRPPERAYLTKEKQRVSARAHDVHGGGDAGRSDTAQALRRGGTALP